MTSEWQEGDEEICGLTIEHDLRETGKGAWECRRCGAEIIEEPEGAEGASHEPA